MAYNNPIFEFADKRPVVAFFLVPMAMSLVGRATAMAIRSAKHGSPLATIMPGKEIDEFTKELENKIYTEIKKYY